MSRSIYGRHSGEKLTDYLYIPKIFETLLNLATRIISNGTTAYGLNDALIDFYLNSISLLSPQPALTTQTNIDTFQSYMSSFEDINLPKIEKIFYKQNNKPQLPISVRLLFLILFDYELPDCLIDEMKEDFEEFFKRIKYKINLISEFAQGNEGYLKFLKIYLFLKVFIRLFKIDDRMKFIEEHFANLIRAEICLFKFNNSNCNEFYSKFICIISLIQSEILTYLNSTELSTFVLKF